MFKGAARMARLGQVIALSVLLGAPAHSEGLSTGTPQSVILTIDQEQLFTGSQFGARVMDGLDKASRELITENRRIQSQLAEEEDELSEKRANMEIGDFRTLADAFDKKATRLRAEQDAKITRLTRQRDRERQRFLTAVLPILSQIVKERGAVAVLEKRSVFISADTIDITQVAIERVNAVLGDGASLSPRVPKPRPEPPRTNPSDTPDASPDVIPED